MKSPLRFVVGLLLASLPAVVLSGQDPAPAEGSIEWLVTAFMKDRKFEHWQTRYTGEMRLFGQRPTPGDTYHDDRYQLELRLNEQDETSAAVAVTVHEVKANQRSDFYLFLRRENELWKLSTIRTFQPGRGLGQMYAALAAKGKDIDAKDLRELNIMQALQVNDWALKQNFAQRRDDYEAIATGSIKKGSTDVIHGTSRSQRADAKLWQLIHDSGLNYVQLQESGIVELNAASFGEAAVGYLYVPNGATAPHATPEDYVLVERIDGPWYLYRRQ